MVRFLDPLLASRLAIPVPDPTYGLLRKRLAQNIRRRRAELNLTQEAVAQSSGLAPRHFQKLEAGELNVTLQTLHSVALALKTEVARLVGGASD